MYYLKIYYINNCHFSTKLLNLLNNNNIEFKQKLINEKKKKLYKSSVIKTFPQVYLKKYNSKGSLLLGGYTDINYILNTIKNNEFEQIYKNLKEKNNNLSKRTILRLIQLFIK